MKVEKYKYIPEYQRIKKKLIPMFVPCFFKGCKRQAIMQVTIMDDDVMIRPSLCGNCAAKPVEELADHFLTREK